MGTDMGSASPVAIDSGPPRRRDGCRWRSYNIAYEAHCTNSLQTGLAYERKEETEDEFNVELFQTKVQHVMVKLNC